MTQPQGNLNRYFKYHFKQYYPKTIQTPNQFSVTRFGAKRNYTVTWHMSAILKIAFSNDKQRQVVRMTHLIGSACLFLNPPIPVSLSREDKVRKNVIKYLVACSWSLAWSDEGIPFHGATGVQQPALNEFTGRRYQRGSCLVRRGGSRSWKLATESSGAGWTGYAGGKEDKLREEDDANDTNIPELVRDALYWPPRRSKDEDTTRPVAARGTETANRAAGVDEDEEGDRIDAVGATEEPASCGSWPRASMRLATLERDGYTCLKRDAELFYLITPILNVRVYVCVPRRGVAGLSRRWYTLISGLDACELRTSAAEIGEAKIHDDI